MSDPAIQKINGANGHGPNGHGVNGHGPDRQGANGTPGQVIDLREATTTRVRVSRDDNPFLALSPPERMKLIIRVLCEIVAYGEIEEDAAAGPDQPVISS